MRLPVLVITALGTLAAAGFSSAPAHSAEQGASCGFPGKPPCPLQDWMRRNVATPVARRDLAKLAEALDRVRALNPDHADWKNWDRFAGDGARAAREGNAARALQSCTSCHEVYRPRYNEQFRKRAVR